MNVFQNALLTVVWLFTIVMCIDLWTSPSIHVGSNIAEKLGGIGLFVSTAIVAHLIIQRILK